MERQPNREELKPTGEYILVEPLPDPLASIGGIMLPTDARRAERYGKVLARGPGFWNNGIFVEPTVKVGQTVLFRRGRGTTVSLNNEEFLFMIERDFLAVVDKEPAVSVSKFKD